MHASAAYWRDRSAATLVPRGSKSNAFFPAISSSGMRIYGLIALRFYSKTSSDLSYLSFKNPAEYEEGTLFSQLLKREMSETTTVFKWKYSLWPCLICFESEKIAATLDFVSLITLKEDQPSTRFSTEVLVLRLLGAIYRKMQRLV